MTNARRGVAHVRRRVADVMRGVAGGVRGVADARGGIRVVPASRRRRRMLSGDPKWISIVRLLDRHSRGPTSMQRRGRVRMNWRCDFIWSTP
jgi:hypothetical protein